MSSLTVPGSGEDIHARAGSRNGQVTPAPTMV